MAVKKIIDEFPPGSSFRQSICFSILSVLNCMVCLLTLNIILCLQSLKVWQENVSITVSCSLLAGGSNIIDINERNERQSPRVLNYTFYSFYMITSLSSKNAMICRHGQWTNSLLPKFACLNMFHPNPKIVGKLGLFWPLWSSAFVHIYCYGLVQSSKINYWCHEKNVLNFSTLT